jgi:hypothetical protein
MKMTRKQFYITEEQDATLKRLAEQSGMTEAELVRIALGHLSADVTYTVDAGETGTGRVRETALMHRYTTSRDETETLRAAQGLVENSVWQEEVAFMKSLAASRSEGGTTERFDREEGYEERLSKILR